MLIEETLLDHNFSQKSIQFHIKESQIPIKNLDKVTVNPCFIRNIRYKISLCQITSEKLYKEALIQ